MPFITVSKEECTACHGTGESIGMNGYLSDCYHTVFVSDTSERNAEMSDELNFAELIEQSSNDDAVARASIAYFDCVCEHDANLLAAECGDALNTWVTTTVNNGQRRRLAANETGETDA